MGKKKKGRNGGGGQPPSTDAAVDALAEALGFAFPPGAIRGVLAQCGGDAGRALDVLLATEPPPGTAVPVYDRIPGYYGDGEEEEDKAIAESGSSSSSSSTKEAEEERSASAGSDGSGVGRSASTEGGHADDGHKEDDDGMVSVAAASKVAVAEYMGAAKAAGRASPSPAPYPSPPPPSERVGGEDGGSGGDSSSFVAPAVSAWELLKTMFKDMLPQGALGATYAHHHGGDEVDGEGDLVAMVEEAARMLANEQEEVEEGEDADDGAAAAAAAGVPTLTLGQQEEEGEDEDEGLMALRNLFPSLPQPMLEATLARFGGDADAAAYDLLGGSPPSSSVGSTAAAHAAATAAAAAATTTAPRSTTRRARPQPLRQVLQSATAAASASPWAPVNPAPATFAVSPPSSSLAGFTAAAIRGSGSSSSSSNGGISPLFAPPVDSTAAFPHLPASPAHSTTATNAGAGVGPARTGFGSARRQGPMASQVAATSSSSGMMAAASRRLAWLEEVYGVEFDKAVIRCLATEVHQGDIAAVEASLAEMDPRGFGRCRQARENRAKEAALLRALSDASSSSSATTPTTHDAAAPTTITTTTILPPPTTAAAECRKRAEAERLAMVGWYMRAAGAYTTGGGAGRAMAAEIARGGEGHRRNFHRANAEAAAGHLRAQSDPPLEVAVALDDRGNASVAVVKVRADEDGELRVDLHGLTVKEALQVIHSLAPLLVPARIRTVRIVTGRGTHSRQGVSRLGPAVLRALESYPYLKATPDSPGGAISVRVRTGQR